MQAVAEYQALEEAEALIELMKLPFLEGNMSNIYNTTREKVFTIKIIDELELNSFYRAIKVSQFLPPQLKAHKYHLLKKFKNKGLPVKKSHSTANSMDLLLKDMSIFCGKKIVAQILQLYKAP